MKTYVILPDLHVEVDPPHKVCVRDIFSHNPYKEKVRYFKTVQNAAKNSGKNLLNKLTSKVKLIQRNTSLRMTLLKH